MNIVFFDLETTGLPMSWNENYKNTFNWPYIVQLAYIISHRENEISSAHDVILKPEGFEIPSESSKVHGISNTKAIIEGDERKRVLQNFATKLKDADYVVAHNSNFDINVLRCEFLRNNIEDPFNSDAFRIICTMKKSTNICKIPSNFGDYKWPSLQELYKKLFDKNFEDAHNAKYDVKATFDCFWKLTTLGVISFKKTIKGKKILFDKDYLLSFFKERNDIFYALVSRYYPINERLGHLLDTQLDWYAVSQNTQINWHSDFIEKFYDKWDIDAESGGYPLDEIKWYGLSSNSNLPWSINLIEKYKEKFAFKYPAEFSLGELSTNPKLPWSYDLIDAFIDDWDWDALSISTFLPWSERFIKTYKDKWDWKSLSENESLPWSINLICQLQDFWYFPSVNKMILESKIKITSKEVIKVYFEDKISIKNVVYLPLNEKFIDLAIDSWEFDWHNFRSYGILPWSAEIIKKYRHKFDGRWSFEVNNNFYWSLDLLRKFENTLIWHLFAHNKNVDWSIEFFNEFEHRINFDEDKNDDPFKIDWKYLKENEGIIWDEVLLDTFYDKLENDHDFWDKLSSAKLNVKWSDELINEYYYHWDWKSLSKNESLCWSEVLIRNYDENWDWDRLCSNAAIAWSDSLFKDYSNHLDATDSYWFLYLLNNCSDNKVAIDYLKSNDKTTHFLKKIWEMSSQELNDDFIVDIFNSINRKQV